MLNETVDKGIVNPEKAKQIRGKALRDFAAFLHSKDANSDFCGLQRVMSDEGKVIWTTAENVEVMKSEAEVGAFVTDQKVSESESETIIAALKKQKEEAVLLMKQKEREKEEAVAEKEREKEEAVAEKEREIEELRNAVAALKPPVGLRGLQSMRSETDDTISS